MLPERQRGGVDGATLGACISIAKHGGLEFDVPYETLSTLNRLRIDAVHFEKAPNSWDTANAVQIAIDFLGAHGLWRRPGATAADGSEGVAIHDPELR